MKVIDKFVADTGVIPEGYTSEETLGVTIRPPSAKQAPVQTARSRMTSYHFLGISLSWGGKETSRGIYLNALNILTVDLLVSVRYGVHIQTALGLLRMEASVGLGWWDRKGPRSGGANR